jgi:hypothetical protein
MLETHDHLWPETWQGRTCKRTIDGDLVNHVMNLRRGGVSDGSDPEGPQVFEGSTENEVLYKL